MIIYGSGEYNSSTSYLTYLSGHETFHQWFYGLVGDAQPVDGWLDEGLATYLGYQFLGSKMAPADFAALWQVDVVERYKAGVAKWGDPPQDSTIYYYVDNHHSFSVGYRKGALLHEEVRAALGTDAYYQLLRDYVAANSMGSRPRRIC